MPQKILIDTDPGIDDAMAILSALRSPELEVIGLTTVFGNAAVENGAINGLRLVELEGNDHIPVAKGAGVPLMLPDQNLASEVHGLDGMGNTNQPLPERGLDGRFAPSFIIDSVKKHPGELILVALGPLTNIALALIQEPEMASLVKGIVLMGGSAFGPGNMSPVAEANIYHDPHAAEIVFRTDWDVSMIGLDVTTDILIKPEDLERIYAADNPAVRLLQEIQPCYQAFHHKIFNFNGAFHLHDPSVIAYLLEPQLFSVLEAPVYVETCGLCSGKTILDQDHLWGSRKNTKVAIKADAKAVISLLTERLTS